MNKSMRLIDLINLKPSVDPLDIFSRWDIPDDDLNAKAISKELERTWQNWSPYARHLLLTAAEHIAHAERAKEQAQNFRRDAGAKRRLTRLAVEGLQAARLAKMIATRCPPPWSDEQSAIRQMVTQLVDFVSCSLRETMIIDDHVATQLAGMMLDELALPANGSPSRDLIARLSWLASGQKGEPLNESSIRRYAIRARPRAAAARYWSRSWKLIVEVSRLVPSASRPSAFASEMRKFVDKP